MSEQKYQFSQPLRIQLDVKVPMTDGVNLSTDIYLPPDGGPFPTLLVRTIYDNQADWCIDMAKRAVPQGYAVVMQGLPGPFRLRRGVQPLLPGAGGRLRHPGMDRRPGVV